MCRRKWHSSRCFISYRRTPPFTSPTPSRLHVSPPPGPQRPRLALVQPLNTTKRGSTTGAIRQRRTGGQSMNERIHMRRAPSRGSVKKLFGMQGIAHPSQLTKQTERESSRQAYKNSPALPLPKQITRSPTLLSVPPPSHQTSSQCRSQALPYPILDVDARSQRWGSDRTIGRGGKTPTSSPLAPFSSMMSRRV